MHQTTKELRKGFAITILPVALLLLLAGGFRYVSSHPVMDDAPPPVVHRGTPRPHHPPPSPPPLVPVDAMTRGDFTGALKFATDEARASWTDSDFRSMVERGYLPLTQAKQKKFSHAVGTKGFCVLPVTIIDDVGRQSKFIYQLGIRQGGGMEVFGCSQVFPDSAQSFPMPQTPRRRLDDFDPI